MKALILYDSQFGNTKKIAEAIGQGITGSVTKSVTEVKISDLAELKILIVGSPTQGGRATANLQKFLDGLSDQSLKGIGVAAFDTRFLEEKQKLPLKLLMKTVGYAGPRLAGILVKKGGKLLVSPEAFIVKDMEGPLADGEEERAKEWGKLLMTKLS